MRAHVVLSFLIFFDELNFCLIFQILRTFSKQTLFCSAVLSSRFWPESRTARLVQPLFKYSVLRFTHLGHLLFLSCFLVLTLYFLKMNSLLQCAWRRRSHTATARAALALPRGTGGALSFAFCWPLLTPMHLPTHPTPSPTFLTFFFYLFGVE